MYEKRISTCNISKFITIIALLFFSCAVSFTPVYAASEFHFSNEFSLTYNDVTGTGKASSSLTEGTHFLNVFGLNGNGEFNQFTYNYLLGLKLTNDRRNDPKDLSLTNLQGRLTNKIHTFTAGDTFEAFSQYSMSTALKGISYKYFNEVKNSPEVTLVYGLAYPRWDSLWRDSATRMIERRAMGARVKYNITPELSTGASVVRSDDARRINDADPLYENTIYEFDMEYRPIPGLTLRGEAAFSDTDLEPAKDAAHQKSDGNSFKLEAIGDGAPSRVTLEFERVAPDFVTLLGSATPDREKFKAKWRYKATKNVTINTGFLWYRNNLDDQKDFTTHHFKPELGVTIKKLLDRQYASTDLAYKLDRKYGGGNSTTNHIVTVNYRDRFGIFDSETNLGYTRYDEQKNIRDAHEYTYNTSLSSRHTVGKLIIKPSLYLGGWNVNDELADTTDRIYEYSLGVGVDVPDMKITSNLKIGQNRLEKGDSSANDSQKTFANLSIYYRPKALAKLNQGMLFLRCLVNDYRYSTGTMNFRENSITAGLNIQL